MTPAQHATNTGALGRPPGTTPDQVTGLPITRIEYPGGTPGVRSFWRPSQAEREAIATGALVSLDVMGQTHAPLFIGVDGVDYDEAAERTAPPFPKGGWQHAIDDALVGYGKTSIDFNTPHEAMAWLLKINADAAVACATQPADGEAFERDDVEAVAACLGDDAAQLRQENEEDERAANMDRAASMLTWMLLSHQRYAPAQLGWLAGKYASVLLPFVRLMEAELHANAGKGDRPGWLTMSADQALLEIYYHVAKLQKAMRQNDGPRIQEHAADVANMAMMALDVSGGLALATLKWDGQPRLEALLASEASV